MIRKILDIILWFPCNEIKRRRELKKKKAFRGIKKT